jgi:hypothetical protein
LLSFFCWDLKKWLTFNYTFFANLEKRGWFLIMGFLNFNRCNFGS